MENPAPTIGGLEKMRLTSTPGWHGWDGGLGTSWFNDPNEDLVAILLTNRMWRSPYPPDVCRDFGKHAYAAIRD